MGRVRGELGGSPGRLGGYRPTLSMVARDKDFGRGSLADGALAQFDKSSCNVFEGLWLNDQLFDPRKVAGAELSVNRALSETLLASESVTTGS